ncbi:MAG: hypothetical protein FK733_09840 [Asgard group archaeon]|nr:hypothetical protein [Asgard group archaeon]
MVNLAISSYYNNWLKVGEGKIWLARKVSKSVDEEDEDLDAISDVEMHRITNMSNIKQKVLT